MTRREPWEVARIAAGSLDLDDVSAEVAEDLAAEKPQLVGEIQDAIGRKGSGAGFHWKPSGMAKHGIAHSEWRVELFSIYYLPVRAKEWTQPLIRDFAF